jgi:hypothetical protein
MIKPAQILTYWRNCHEILYSRIVAANADHFACLLEGAQRLGSQPGHCVSEDGHGEVVSSELGIAIFK